MMTALQRGAEYITDEELALKADHQELVSVRISAQKLLQLIDRAIYAKLEGERTRALQQVILAVRQQREIQHAAETQNIQLEFEIAKLKRERGDLSEKLEHEKDRTTCRICFVRPRNVLPLPCLHFDYCSICLHQHQKTRNLCPTCRSPISGVLKCNLTMG
eukprot:c21281_g1_i2 orf=525-1007(-)